MVEKPNQPDAVLAFTRTKPISRGIIRATERDKNLDCEASHPDEKPGEAGTKGKATWPSWVPKDFGTEAGHALFAAARSRKSLYCNDPSHANRIRHGAGNPERAVMQAVSKEMFSARAARRCREARAPS